MLLNRREQPSLGTGLSKTASDFTCSSINNYGLGLSN
jgi:hypothetical protein